MFTWYEYLYFIFGIDQLGMAWYPDNWTYIYWSIKEHDSIYGCFEIWMPQYPNIVMPRYVIMPTLFFDIWTLESWKLDIRIHDFISGHSISGFSMSGYKVLLDIWSPIIAVPLCYYFIFCINKLLMATTFYAWQPWSACILTRTVWDHMIFCRFLPITCLLTRVKALV